MIHTCYWIWLWLTRRRIQCLAFTQQILSRELSKKHSHSFQNASHHLQQTVNTSMHSMYQLMSLYSPLVLILFYSIDLLSSSHHELFSRILFFSQDFLNDLITLTNGVTTVDLLLAITYVVLSFHWNIHEISDFSITSTHTSKIVEKWLTGCDIMFQNLILTHHARHTEKFLSVY